MFKVHRDLSKNFSIRELPKVESIYNGFESIACLGPKIWDMAPSELKEMSSISSFKKAIMVWYPRNCLCRLCKAGFPNMLTLYIYL